MMCSTVMLLALAACAASRTQAVAPPPPAPCAGDTNGAVTSSSTFAAFPEPKLVPWPKDVTIWGRDEGYFYPNASTVIGLNGNATEQATLRVAAELLASEIALVTGGVLSPKVIAEEKYLSGPHIHLFLAGDLGGAEASETRVERHGAVLTGATGAGMMSATATFLQLLEKAGDTDGKKSPACTASGGPAWRLPVVDVNDDPAFGIRGVMVDAARAFLPLPLLKEYVVMCRLYKINHLHIHLSDDGSFTFPSTKYPELAAKARFSCAYSPCLSTPTPANVSHLLTAVPLLLRTQTSLRTCRSYSSSQPPGASSSSVRWTSPGTHPV